MGNTNRLRGLFTHTRNCSVIMKKEGNRLTELIAGILYIALVTYIVS